MFQKAWAKTIFVGLIAGVFLTGCQAVSTGQAPLESTPVPTAAPKSPTSQIITHEGQPIGYILPGETILNFPAPQAKLATDPVPFTASVEEGIGTFLITPKKPSWYATCVEETRRPGVMVCTTGEKEVYLMERQVNGVSVWLAVSTEDPKGLRELNRVADGLSTTYSESF